MALYTDVMSLRIKTGQNEVRLEFLLEFETGKNFQTTFTVKAYLAWLDNVNSLLKQKLRYCQRRHRSHTPT